MDFELGPDGNIRVFPLTGFSTALAAGMACLLRLEHVESEAALRAGHVKALQLVLTPAQARALAKALTTMAGAADRPEQSGAPQ